jgi:hypothetical protein
VRLTLQANRNNKFSFHFDRSVKWRGHRPNNWLTASINDPISDVVQTTQLNYIGEIKWSSTIGSRLLAEAAMFTMPVNYTLGIRARRRAGCDRDLRSDQVGDQRRVAAHGHEQRADVHLRGNVSYITGEHSLKVGAQVRTGWSQELFTMRGDILQITNNGVANSVRLVNTPSGHKEEGVNSALFVQDSWRLGRWTLNPGVRYERFVMSIPAQGAGRRHVGPARDFAAQDGLVNWNTVSPRLGFSWDVFGDGRTALKGGVSRYDRLEGVTIIQPLNQLNISFRTCPWSDTNGDKNAQNNEIAFASCSGSLQPALGNVDSGLKRPHQWEYTAMVQRQIGSNTSVSIGYYGRRLR